MKQSFLAVLALLASLGVSNAHSSDLVVHEWGTFTSMQDSKGHLLDGLYHEDEPLPEFVYGRDQFSQVTADLNHCCHKRVEPLVGGGKTALLAVNEKLETPVIYFHSKEPLKASVTVQFPKGIISQWFPNASQFAPAVDQLHDFSHGSMSWNVDVLGKSDVKLPAITDGSIWAPSRQVDANPVRVGGETERFIFYRGLGRFDTPLQVTSSEKDLTVWNPSPETVASAFVIESDDHSGGIVSLGAIQAGAHQGVTFDAIKGHHEPTAVYLAHVASVLESALVQSGLYRDEAAAMVHTWEKSYFKTNGIRVLYVLPRKWTDQILPIQVQPEPRELVRTLIGRIEVLTQTEERAILGKIQSSSADFPKTLGRFAEPKLRRALQLESEPEAIKKTQAMLQEIQ